ncbi:MAG: DNA mismatch repair protein MutH [Myxococcota bacterium]
MVATPRRPAPADEAELMLRASALAGRTVAELAQALRIAVPSDPRRSKGFVGQLVELALGADPEAGERPDFLTLGIELKTLPLGARGKPSESTFCCSIALETAADARFESSRLRARIDRVLFVPVDGAKSGPIGDRRFHSPVLWSPDPEEERVLRDDWNELMGRIGAGLPLSAHLGEALQVRPKAANARVRVMAVGEAKAPVAFYLRARFTAAILARHSGELNGS